jgi:hypothetical protein
MERWKDCYTLPTLAIASLDFGVKVGRSSNSRLMCDTAQLPATWYSNAVARLRLHQILAPNFFQ